MTTAAARADAGALTRMNAAIPSVMGCGIYYEAYGTGEPTILFLPTWEIVHSRTWKFQIPYFARHGRW